MKDAKKTVRDVTTAFKFWDLIQAQGIDLDAFWNYQGSLTTPTCNPVVEWIVMRDHISLPPTLVRATHVRVADSSKCETQAGLIQFDSSAS